jgi:hypothetical protein
MIWRVWFRQSSIPVITVFIALFSCSALPQDATPGMPASLSPSEIVERMQRHNQEQDERLERYQALRHYAVEYKGFLKRIRAAMDVEVNYDAASGKSFRVVSQSGSGTLCQKVLKRAVDSEQEAALIKDETALTEDNYTFRLLGSETLHDRPAYTLYVEPLKERKFLYRGKIWVDAADFALAKLEVEPAKNPSFWISRALIHHTYAQTRGFWLPEYDRSETQVRIGGRAVMTIDYGTYVIVPRQVAPVMNTPQSAELQRVEPSLQTSLPLLPMD